MSKINKLSYEKSTCYTSNNFKDNTKMCATLVALFNIDLNNFEYDSKKNCYIDSTKKVVVSLRENEKNIALQVNVASDFDSLITCTHRNKSEDVVIDGVTYIRVMHVWALTTKIHVYIDEPVALNMLVDCEAVAQDFASKFECINDSDRLFCDYAFRFQLKSKDFDSIDALGAYIDAIPAARVATYKAEQKEA
jgi:hypothetical protein